MMKTIMTGMTLVISMLVAGIAFADDVPTLHQIYEAAQAGRMNDAQAMINKVLKEHPGSAKAHYVDAELLARTGRMAEARAELGTAERLEPGLPFATPQAVQQLRSLVSQDRAKLMPATTSQTPQQGFPWGWLLLGIGSIAIITFIMRSLARPGANVMQPAYPSAYPGNMPPPGYMPAGGAGYGPGAPGMGSGIISGLATGAALGAGMVAGEELVHHFIDGNSGNANAAPMAQPMNTAWDNPSDNMGGQDFGIADNTSWDDNSNIADISGGDDWS